MTISISESIWILPYRTIIPLYEVMQLCILFKKSPFKTIARKLKILPERGYISSTCDIVSVIMSNFGDSTRVTATTNEGNL